MYDYQNILNVAHEIQDLLIFLVRPESEAELLSKELSRLLTLAEADSENDSLIEQILELLWQHSSTKDWMENKLSPQSTEGVTRGGDDTSCGETLRSFEENDEPFDKKDIEESADDRNIYPVWFGTNREPINKKDLSKGFSNKRAKEAGVVYYGRCHIDIPESRRFGEIGRFWLRRWVNLNFKDDHVKINKIIGCKNADDFWSQLNSAFNDNEDSEKDAVVFLHGYNNSFKDAAVRAAQIGCDLGVRGHTAFFSWPSSNRFFRYSSDVDSIKLSENAITEFLLDFTEKSGAKRIHLIAHSMGNRGLLRALKNITNKIENSDLDIKFGQIILAAPDLDVDTFKQAAHVYPALSESTTIYASSKDIAVGGARILMGYPRLGFVPPITVMPDIDTIKVKHFDIHNLLGHSFFAEAEALLSDMFDLIHHGQRPKERQRPKRQTTEDGKTYWLIDT